MLRFMSTQTRQFLSQCLFQPDPTAMLNLLCRPVPQIHQLLRLPAVQPRRDGECRVHSHDAGIEVEFGHALEAARGTLLDAHAATLAVVDQNLIETVRTRRTHDAWLGADQITVVAGVAGAATETAAGLLDHLFFREPLNHFLLRFASAYRRQQRLPDTGEVREIRHVHAVQIHDDVDGDFPRLQRLPAQYLVQIECDALPVANRIHHHQRLTRTQLHNVACRKKVRVAETPEAVNLDGATLALELVGQPTERGPLSHSDDHVVDSETLGWGFSIDGDRRGVDGAGEPRRI